MISPQSAVTSAHNKKKTQIIFMCTLYSVKPTVTFASSKMQIYWHGIQKQCVFCSDLNFCVFFEKKHKLQSYTLFPYTDTMSVAADRAEILIGGGDLIFISRSFQQAIRQRLEKHFTK